MSFHLSLFFKEESAKNYSKKSKRIQQWFSHFAKIRKRTFGNGMNLLQIFYIQYVTGFFYFLCKLKDATMMNRTSNNSKRVF